jgi:hypothetical protein
MRRNQARRKERHRLRRKRKAEELRKAREPRGFTVLADPRPPIRCFISERWRESGIASIMVLKQLPSGGHAVGSFLVDLLCCGLKDCWGWLDVSRGEFERRIRETFEMTGIEFVPVDPGTATRLVAGGIRFAHQNRLRLPPRHERWVAMLGISGPQRDADLSEFGVDGDPAKLRYIGQIEDLRKRLIGESVEEFTERTGLKFIFGGDPRELGLVDAESEDEDDCWIDLGGDDVDDGEDGEADDVDDVIERGLALVRARVLDLTRRWCFRNGVVPHRMLRDAADLLAIVLEQTPIGEEPRDGGASFDGSRLIDRALELEEARDREGLREAIAQVQAAVTEFESTEDLIEALSLAPEND